MGFKQTKNNIKEYHEKLIHDIHKTMTEALDRTMIKVMAIAKNTDTYTDRTNNLRSSIGYVLYFDGVQVSASFETGGKGTEGTGAEGAKKGQKFADEVAKNYPRGYVAILVAGMNYAAYVEAKNFDVLTGASLQVKGIFESNWKIAVEEIRDTTGIKLNKISLK